MATINKPKLSANFSKKEKKNVTALRSLLTIFTRLKELKEVSAVFRRAFSKKKNKKKRGRVFIFLLQKLEIFFLDRKKHEINII